MLGDIGIIEVDSLGLNFAAVTKRNIANEEDDVFLLGLQLGGSATLIQDGREATLQPATSHSSTRSGPMSAATRLSGGGSS